MKQYIDYWVIVDTGSSDGTQGLIREYLKDTPGALYERPWIDFAHNRNEALQLAKDRGDYILFLDADQFLALDRGAPFPSLEGDICYCRINTDVETYYHELAVASRLDWKWVGAVHEGLVSSQAKNSVVLSHVRIVATQEGNRSKTGNKYLGDAAVLKKELEKDPTCARNVFYLALSLAMSGDLANALVQYEKRASMEGKPEETFAAQLSIGEMQERLGMRPAVFLKSYETAYLMRPTRAEPLFAMARHFLNVKNYLMAYLISQFALTIPYPEDRDFVRFSIYDYELLMQWAESAYELGKIDETCEAYRKLIEQFEKMADRYDLSQSLKEKIRDLLPGMKQFLIENAQRVQ